MRIAARHSTRNAANDLPFVRDAHVTALGRFHQGFIAVFQYLSGTLHGTTTDAAQPAA